VSNFTHSFIDLDLAYAAGIVDGEGTIGITEIGARPKKGRKNPQHRIYVAVAMTDAAIPLLMSEMFGGSVNTYHYHPERNRPQTRWSLSGKRAVLCLEALLPYLRLKNAQAELAINFQEKYLKRKRNSVLDELEERRRSVQEMQQLNARRVV
jgi:hypothetical protein